MLLTTAEDLARFVDELRSESDRGLVLVSAAVLDEALSRTLRAFFREVKSAEVLLNGAHAPLGSFSARIHASYALGLIDDCEFAVTSLLRKIRNEFAHSPHGFDFRDERVAGLCSSLVSELRSVNEDAGVVPREQVARASLFLILRLYHRHDWIVQSRCTNWNWKDEHQLHPKLA